MSTIEKIKLAGGAMTSIALYFCLVALPLV
jgi:hypothetical protein